MCIHGEAKGRLWMMPHNVGSLTQGAQSLRKHSEAHTPTPGLEGFFFSPPQGIKMSSVGDAKQSSATTQFLPAVYSLWMLNYRWPFDLNTSGVLYV